MSVRLWAYEPWKCDGDFCPGRCDRCRKRDQQFCEECTHEEEAICSDCEVLKEEGEK